MPDKVMIVVGGSRGIGAAVARGAVEDGWKVVVTYASGKDEATELVRELGAAVAIHCDVRSDSDIIHLFERASKEGELAALVYSSGITGSASRLSDVSTRTLEDVIAVNLTGAMLCAREAVRHLHPEIGCSITFISSRASERGSPGEYVWYAASKGGLNSFSTGLAREVAEDGIRVNCVSPGPVETGMLDSERLAKGAASVPMRRAASPTEVANAVLFLASDKASYITGANIAVAGGA